MQIKSALLRHFAATAEAWNMDTAWIIGSDNHANLVLPDREGTTWLITAIDGTAPTISGQFSIKEFTEALFALRGNVDVLLTPASLALDTKLILLTASTIAVPSISVENPVRIDGHAWTTFFEKAKKYAWKPEDEKWNGILVDGSGTTTALVVCDNFRLFYYDTGVPGNTVRVMLPAQLCEAWQTLEQFDINFSKDQVVFTAPSERLIGRIRPAVFPDYQHLLLPGDKSITFKRDDIAFLQKNKAITIEVGFKETSMYLEWFGPWGEPELSGDKKIAAACTITGKEVFTRLSFLPLLDDGENITVTTNGLRHPYRTTIGGLVYVFKGRDD